MFVGLEERLEAESFSWLIRHFDVCAKDDQDFHIVIASPQNPRATMIVEIPSTDCEDACASSHASDFQTARKTVIDRLGQPPGIVSFLQTPLPVVVRGVGFFDFFHHQTGVAPNVIELHPVLSITFTDNSPFSGFLADPSAITENERDARALAALPTAAASAKEEGKKKGGNPMNALIPVTHPAIAWLVFFLVLLLFWLLGMVVARKQGPNTASLALIGGSDNRLSLSRLQAYAWTLIIFASFCAAMTIGKSVSAETWIKIPPELLTLAGIAIGSGVFSSLIAAANGEEKTATIDSIENDPAAPAGTTRYLIKGRNFGNNPGNAILTFQGQPASVISWSDTLITVMATQAISPVVLDTPNGKVCLKVTPNAPPFTLQPTGCYQFTDLFRDDKNPNVLSLMKFQMFGWTLVRLFALFTPSRLCGRLPLSWSRNSSCLFWHRSDFTVVSPILDERAQAQLATPADLQLDYRCPNQISRRSDAPVYHAL